MLLEHHKGRVNAFISYSIVGPFLFTRGWLLLNVTFTQIYPNVFQMLQLNNAKNYIPKKKFYEFTLFQALI